MTAGLPIDATILLGAGLLVLGILVVGISDRLRLPASILSLALGMILGSDVLGWVNVDDAALVRDLSVIALVIILFEGGLTTKPSALREAGLPGFALSTLGVAITAGVTAVAVQLVFSTGWQTALLLGAVVASTDAAVVFDFLRRAPLPRRLSEVLEVESGANDPFAIVLTIGLLYAFDVGASASDWVIFGGLQLLGGLIVGTAVGAVGVVILRLELRSQGLYPLVAIGLAGLSYSLTALVSGSGFLAVYVTGLVIGAFVPRHRRVIRSFHASLANGADIGLFLMLGLLVFPSRLGSVAVPALVVTAILVLVARPLAVAVSTAPFGFSWREKAVLSWAGLRGAVPIVLATFPLTAGVADGQTIFDVVFFVVVTSTLLQGTTTVPLVRRLGLEAAQPAWRSIAEALPLDSSDIDLAEIVVTPDLWLAGSSLRTRPPSEGVRVIAVLREDTALLPTGDTVLALGDTVVVAIDTQRAGLTDVTAWARGEVENGGDSK
jgi:potassium/hydrogen antiporter